jgi:hypothetical protein
MKTTLPKTKARLVYEKLLTSPLAEEMTQHDMPGAVPQGVSSEYRGLAKVVKYTDDNAKNWLGIGMPFYVDMKTGETSLLAPNGDMASVQDVLGCCHIEAFTPHP